MFKKIALGIAATMLVALPALAQQTLKIGYITMLTGPISNIGNDMRDGFELAIDHKNRLLGGLKTEVIYLDSQMKPEIAKQMTDKLIDSDHVNFLSGYALSNELLASLKSANDGKTFLISNNAGASQVAGEMCSPWFFSTAFENNQRPSAMGQLLNKRGIKKLFVLAPNYTAGKDMVAGVKATYKGEIVGEEYTRWPSQLDFSVEMSKIRAAKPDAIWVFTPGSYGVQFFAQFQQAGLLGKLPIYSNFSVDAMSLPLIGEAAMGALSTDNWVEDLDIPTNKRFVADFKKKYKHTPSFYAAQAYDGALLIDSAVRAVKGDLANKDGMREAMKKIDFETTRGRLKYGNNHFLIQNIYVAEAVKTADGIMGLHVLDNISPNNQDTHHSQCPMK